ncbi:MAG TPA: DUF4350 domain-containing protein [Pyrinomonadaceae bacterium]|nr:DUF4350 domain-containing protein [Pyrinomonadaceae bacterium]
MNVRHSLFTLIVVLLVSFSPVQAQQGPDPSFNANVEKPAYTRNFPRVMFDEAHNNFHTVTGRYKPFADLIFSDGYQVVVNRKPFNEQSLKAFKILVIANALGAEDLGDDGDDRPAFTDAEADAVRSWVKSGGSLLLIADHAPFGGAAEILSKRFGVTMSKGYVADPKNSRPGAASLLIFSRENKLLLDHPITGGRDESERINQVFTFTGQALKGPDDAQTFMKLADTAKDSPTPQSSESTSVAGQAQGLALKFGKGRVVMMGEAAMLSAQVAGPQNFQMGMNVPGSDNKQLVLNIMHWLSGLLK